MKKKKKTKKKKEKKSKKKKKRKEVKEVKGKELRKGTRNTELGILELGMEHQRLNVKHSTFFALFAIP